MNATLDPDYDELEIPESPGAAEAIVPASTHSHYCSDEEGGVRLSATASPDTDSAVQQSQEHQDQDGTQNGEESGQEFTHNANQTESLTIGDPPPRQEICVSLAEITFSSVKDHRESAHGTEYWVAGMVWLHPSSGVPLHLVEAYRKQMAREKRYATLRKRKRTTEEVEVAQGTRCGKIRRVEDGSLTCVEY